MIEFAVCLPLLSLLVFGTIESTSRIYLKQTLSIAAYETAREAIRNSSTAASAIHSGRSILNARQVDRGTIVLMPADPARARRGQAITVTVSAPAHVSSPMLGKLIADDTLTVTVVMLKE